MRCKNTKLYYALLIVWKGKENYTHYKLGCLSTWPNFFLLISKSSILYVKIIPKHELSIKTHNIWRNNVASHTHTTRPHSKHSWLGAVPRFYIHTHTLTMYQLILLWKSRAPPKHTHTHTPLETQLFRQCEKGGGTEGRGIKGKGQRQLRVE